MANLSNRALRTLLLTSFLGLAPAAVAAQDGFMFQPPVATLTLRAGANMLAANDELFKFFTSELTLEKRDFRTVTWGGDLAVRLTPRVDLVLGAMHAKSEKASEFRHLEGTDDLPIEQTTTLKQTPVTASIKLFAFERGRSVGKFAWVPRNFLPYVGAGAGLIWYDLEQVGDFVDHETMDIFFDTIESSGNSGMIQVFGGTEWWPQSRFGLTAEARYIWGKANLINGFTDFDKIDLRGFQLTAGIATRF
jgi:hypothetical protein